MPLLALFFYSFTILCSEKQKQIGIGQYFPIFGKKLEPVWSDLSIQEQMKIIKETLNPLKTGFWVTFYVRSRI